MFRKALKTIAPTAFGSIAGLLAVALFLGVQAAVKTIIPVAFGIAAGFTAALMMAKKEAGRKNR